MGIAKLEQVDGELINQIGELLKTKLNNMAFSAINKTDGLKTIVNILNNVSRGVEKQSFKNWMKSIMSYLRKLKKICLSLKTYLVLKILRFAVY